MGHIIQQVQINCSICQGTGYSTSKENTCQICNGKGSIKDNIQKHIFLPPNFDYNSIITFISDGSYNYKLDRNKDLLIKFRVIKSENFDIINIKGFDIYINYNINIYNAIQSKNIYLLNHPNKKKYILEYSNIIHDNENFICKGLGLPTNNINNFGNLYIVFNYIYPDKVLNYESYLLYMNNQTTPIDTTDFIKIKLLPNNDKRHDFQNQSNQCQPF